MRTLNVKRYTNGFIEGFLLVLLFANMSFGQAKETVLYSFGASQTDGTGPSGRLVFDNAGNIFGTTVSGGANCQAHDGCGTVFELSPSPTGWTETILYSFCQNDVAKCPDGSEPWAGLTFDKVGNLYGTTFAGGIGLGVVFELSPPSQPGGNWTEAVLWIFGKKNGDGEFPQTGTLNWDEAGNLYGTTGNGGISNQGTVFELSPQAGGVWKEKVLHRFNGTDGANPQSGVAIDNSGNLYGTAEHGGPAGAGVVYKLSPNPKGGWTETVLHKFDGQSAANPVSAISIDHAGNLYGTFLDGGDGTCIFGTGCGGVFKFSRNGQGGLTKMFFRFDDENGGNPQSGVIVDEKSGVILGTTLNGDNVYAIRGTKETVLYTFCTQLGCPDGSSPSAGLLTPRADKLYGATRLGGANHNAGVIFSISR